MPRSVFAMSCMALVLPFAALAQDQPDFSGAWRMDPSRSESAHQAVPIGPVTVIIKQTPAEVVIETRRSENNKSAPSSEILTFLLDGSESTIVGSTGVPVKTKAHWDGANLVTETARNVRGSTVTTLHVLSLEPGGRELTINKTLTVQHGYRFPGANTTGTGKD